MKLKLISLLIVFIGYVHSPLYSFSQKQMRDSILIKNLREEVALSQRLIKQLQGDKTKLQREVKRLKESLQTLETRKNSIEDSLESEIQTRNDTIDFKETVIQMLTTHLQMKRDTIQQLCTDTINYGTRYRTLEAFAQQKDEWSRQQTKTLEEHQKTIESLRVSFLETERILRQQNTALQREYDSLKNFIFFNLQADSLKNKPLIPQK